MIAVGRLLLVATAALWATSANLASAGQVSTVGSALKAQAVQIMSEPGVRLAAELFIPSGTRVPAPAVLLLGGGGPSPHGIYPLVEAKLHAKGIATLSFDKRGVGASTGTFVDAMQPMTNDARAALDYLKSRRDVVDTNRIAILGLSQGGVIAAALAAEDPTVAAIVMLASPAGQRGKMFLDSMREKLTASGMEHTAIDRVVTATQRYLEARTNEGSQSAIAADRVELVKAFVQGGWKQELAEGAVQTLSEPATSSLYTVAASDVLSRIRAPVLAMYAADDTVVSNALSVPEAQRALSNNRNARVVVMPNVEHGFKPLTYTTEGKKDYRGWPISDPASLDLIDSWLPTHLLHSEK